MEGKGRQGVVVGRRPYNTLALPCECVMMLTIFGKIHHHEFKTNCVILQHICLLLHSFVKNILNNFNVIQLTSAKVQ